MVSLNMRLKSRNSYRILLNFGILVPVDMKALDDPCILMLSCKYHTQALGCHHILRIMGDIKAAFDVLLCLSHVVCLIPPSPPPPPPPPPPFFPPILPLGRYRVNGMCECWEYWLVDRYHFCGRGGGGGGGGGIVPNYKELN